VISGSQLLPLRPVVVGPPLHRQHRQPPHFRDVGERVGIRDHSVEVLSAEANQPRQEVPKAVSGAQAGRDPVAGCPHRPGLGTAAGCGERNVELHDLRWPLRREPALDPPRPVRLPRRLLDQRPEVGHLRIVAVIKGASPGSATVVRAIAHADRAPSDKDARRTLLPLRALLALIVVGDAP